MQRPISNNLEKFSLFICASIDTEPVYEKVFQEVTTKYGKPLTPEVRIKLLGSTERRSCEICVNDLGLNVSIEDFVKDFRELSQQRLPNVDFMPGAERLVRHLHANKVPICVATSSGEDSVKVKTNKHLEVFNLFHHITKGTDPELKQGKPAPDIFLLAATRFDEKADPSNVSHIIIFQLINLNIIFQCLVLEDAPNGVEGALAAKMQVVMVPADYISDEFKSRDTIALKSLNDFKPELFGLPPFIN